MCCLKFFALEVFLFPLGKIRDGKWSICEVKPAGVCWLSLFHLKKHLPSICLSQPSSSLIPNVRLWFCQLFWWNCKQPLAVTNVSESLFLIPVFSLCDTSLKQLFLVRKWRKKGSNKELSTCVILKHWLSLVGTDSTCKAINMSLKAACAEDCIQSTEKARSDASALGY